MKRHLSLCFGVVAVAGVIYGQGGTRDNSVDSFDQVVDRAIAQENDLLKIVRGEHPVAETYIQDLGTDADFGTAPKTDHYFLGKLDLSKGVTADSFIPKGKVKTRALDVFSNLFSIQYVPRGFAQMLLIDGDGFVDRSIVATPVSMTVPDSVSIA